MSDFFAPAWWVGGNPFAAGAADLAQNQAAMQAQQAEAARIAAISAQHQATIQQTTGNLTQDPAHYAAVGAAYGRHTGGFNGGGGAAFQPGAFGSNIQYGPDYGPLGGGTSTPYGDDYGALPAENPDVLGQYANGGFDPFDPNTYGGSHPSIGGKPQPVTRNPVTEGTAQVPQNVTNPWTQGTSPVPYTQPSGQHVPGSWGAYAEMYVPTGINPDTLYQMFQRGEAPNSSVINTPAERQYVPQQVPAQPPAQQGPQQGAWLQEPLPSWTPSAPSGQHAPGTWGEYTEKYLSSGIHPDRLYEMYQAGQTPGSASFNDRFGALPGAGATVPGNAQLPPEITTGFPAQPVTQPPSMPSQPAPPAPPGGDFEWTPGQSSGQHAPGSWGAYAEMYVPSGINPDTLYQMYQAGQTPGSRDSIANALMQQQGGSAPIVAQGGDDFDAYNFQSPANAYDKFQLGRSGNVASGTASTYDPTQTGWRTGGMETSSGQTYDPSAYTAAIQTSLRDRFGGAAYGRKPGQAVVQGPGGQQVVVDINDVGPLTQGRIIDLSTAAMKYLNPLARANSGLLPGAQVTELPAGGYPTGPAGPVGPYGPMPGTPGIPLPGYEQRPTTETRGYVR